MTADHELLATLAQVLDQVDPVPEHLTVASEAVFSLRANDSIMLRLAAAPAGMRGASPALRFTGSSVTVDLQLHVDGRMGLHALGLVHPVSRGSTAVACWPGGSRTTTIDAIGWFSVSSLPPGPLRFLVRRPGSPDLSTGWFVG
jgi:hypothetical protein